VHSVTVNGRSHLVATLLTYDCVVALAGFPGAKTLCVTFRNKDHAPRILAHGEAVAVRPASSMAFTVKPDCV
jgi:hypothetical protein